LSGPEGLNDDRGGPGPPATQDQEASMDAQRSGNPDRRRLGVGALIVAALLASLALVAASGLGSEHAATQQLTVTLAKGKTTVGDTSTLVSGLTRVTARNTGSKPANFALVRIKPGKTFADLQAALNRSPDVPEGTTATLTSFFGVAPGRTFVTTLDLPPGDYVVTQPPDGKGLGPAAQFSLPDGSAGGSPPATTGTVMLYDYGIRAPAALSGRGTLKINNVGANYHFVMALKLGPGVTSGSVIKELRARTFQGKGVQFIPIIGVVNPGSINYVPVRLRPGDYVLVCFYGDRHSAGHDHAQFGMETAVTVR
jgi:hypothetical protein